MPVILPPSPSGPGPPSQVLARQGPDLHSVFPLTWAQAVLGAVVEVPGMDSFSPCVTPQRR